MNTRLQNFRVYASLLSLLFLSLFSSTHVSAKDLSEMLGSGNYVVYYEMTLAEMARQSKTSAEAFKPLEEAYKNRLPWVSREVNAFLDLYKSESETAKVYSAALSTQQRLPHFLVVFQFASPEVATKFEQDSKPLIRTIKEKLAKYFAEMSLKAAKGQTKRQARTKAPKNPFADFQIFTTRTDNMVAFSEKRFSFADLNAPADHSLAKDAYYAKARERFSSGGGMFLLDMSALLDNAAVWIKEIDRLGSMTQASAAREMRTEASPGPITKNLPLGLITSIAGLLKKNMPAALAGFAKIEGEYMKYDLLDMPRPDNPSSLSGLFPIPVAGPAISAESPKLIPEDTSLCGAVSVDFLKTYDRSLDIARAGMKIAGMPDPDQKVNTTVSDFETNSKFKVRDELLASLGNEVGYSVKVKPYVDGKVTAGPPPVSVNVLFSLADRKKFEEILPMVLELGGKSTAIKQEQYSSYNLTTCGEIAYTFIDDFFVLANNATALREMIDSKTQGRTIAANSEFQSSIGSRQLIGSFYLPAKAVTDLINIVEKAMPAGYLADAQSTITNVKENPRPVIYTITPESSGLLHQVQFPVNLYTAYLAGFISSTLKAEEKITGPSGPTRAIRRQRRR